MSPKEARGWRARLVPCPPNASLINCRHHKFNRKRPTPCVHDSPAQELQRQPHGVVDDVVAWRPALEGRERVRPFICVAKKKQKKKNNNLH